jgi:hypothetical protein
MQVLFQQLLNNADGWDQPQREALVDLCLLGMYSDNLISLAEQDFIDAESNQLKWDSGISFSGYLQRTFPKIRSAKADAQQVASFLQTISDRLGTAELKRSAVDELQKLLASDGVVKPEADFLSEVHRVLGLT